MNSFQEASIHLMPSSLWTRNIFKTATVFLVNWRWKKRETHFLTPPVYSNGCSKLGHFYLTSVYRWRNLLCKVSRPERHCATLRVGCQRTLNLAVIPVVIFPDVYSKTFKHTADLGEKSVQLTPILVMYCLTVYLSIYLSFICFFMHFQSKLP